MSKELQQVEKLIEEGKHEDARDILLEILKTNSANDEAWVLLASVTADRTERQKHLEEALKHNPRNQVAQRILQKMNVPLETKVAKAALQLSPLEHMLCGWPLILVFLGGAIGGLLGGIAYGANVAIYKANIPSPVKFVLNPVIGFSAIGLWLVIAKAITR